MAKYNKKRKYISVCVEQDVDVDLDDFIDDIDDEDIMNQASKRGLFKQKPFDLNRDTICNHFGVSRYTTVPEILKLINDKLELES